MGIDSQRLAPVALPRERDPVPIVSEAVWPPGPVWTSGENLAPTGFDPRTVQPVASRYAYLTIAALCLNDMKNNLNTHNMDNIKISTMMNI